MTLPARTCNLQVCGGRRPGSRRSAGCKGLGQDCRSGRRVEPQVGGLHHGAVAVALVEDEQINDPDMTNASPKAVHRFRLQRIEKEIAGTRDPGTTGLPSIVKAELMQLKERGQAMPRKRKINAKSRIRHDALHQCTSTEHLAGNLRAVNASRAAATSIASKLIVPSHNADNLDGDLCVLLLNLNPVDLMGTIAVVVDTGLRNGDGSSRADVIRRHCSIGREVFVRRTCEQLGPHSMAVFLRVPRFFGLLGSRLAQIGYLDTRAEAMMSKVEPAEKEVRASSNPFMRPRKKTIHASRSSID